MSLRLSWLSFSGTSGRHAECVPTQSTWRRGTDSSYFPIVWGLSSRATYTPPLKTPYFSVMLTSGHSSEKTQRIKVKRCILCAWSRGTILREVTRNRAIQMQQQSQELRELTRETKNVHSNKIVFQKNPLFFTSLPVVEILNSVFNQKVIKQWYPWLYLCGTGRD